MLRTYLINFVLVLVLASNASATPPPYACTWVGGSGLWNTPAKWTGGVPDITTTAGINVADANCRIDSVTANCNTLDVAYDTGPCYLNMTGGTLTISGLFFVGDDPSPGAADTNGVFIMSGGDVNIGGKLQIGDGTNDEGAEPSYGTLIMTGGVIHARGSSVEVGKNKSGNGWIYMQGGTLDINVGTSTDLLIATYGHGTIYMTGGYIDITDRLRLASDSGGLTSGTGKIYLDGGTIFVDNAEIVINDNSFIDITKGTLIVDGGADESVNELVSLNKIRGYGGEGYVVVVEEDLGGGAERTTVTGMPGDPNLAWGPSPANRAIVEWTPAGPTLSWKPGQYAAKHDVYFGTDEDDVNDATDPNALPGRGRQNPCTFAFPSPPPEFDQTYYWRIDEVNDACAPNIWKGLVWQFTMADYEEVEDFDSYANDAALAAVWTLTGLESSEIHLETTILRSGNSMKYVYTNDSATEAYANTTGANKLPVDITDWTTADIKALTLYFYGDGYNSAENMYVALKSTDNKSAVVYYDNPNDLKEPEWHEWNIKLSDFTDVNLHSIAKVYIGFGNRGSPPASDGTVYFDDIRLYPKRCIASFAPDGDVDGDCNVGFVDVNIMAGDWLDTDVIRKGSDGVLKGGASWVTDGTRHCVQLDGTNGWVDLDDSDFSNFRNKTIAFWVKVRAYLNSYPYMFYFNNGDEDNPYRIYFRTYTPASYYVRVFFVDDYSDNFTAGQNVWRHLALVIKDTADGRCTGEFYGNGGLVALTPMPGRPRHSGGATGVNLGSAKDGSSGFVNAVFDDFRVYDKALTGTEVQNLYNGTAPDANMLLHYDFNEVGPNTVAHNSSTYEFYHPLLSDAELYEGEVEGYRVVNLKDFAILADSWLEEQLWP
jgi:hypothetical protein